MSRFILAITLFLLQGEAVSAILPLPSTHASDLSPLVAGPAASPTEGRLLHVQARNQVFGFRNGGWFVSNGTYILRVGFVGANNVQPQSAGVSARQPDLAPLDRVTYANLWNGIDLSYRAVSDGIVESLYKIAPGADPANIRLSYNVPLALNKDGTLTARFTAGTATESAPIAWQEIDGRRVEVPVHFNLTAGDGQVAGSELSFAVGDYDRNTPLIIDPTLTWNTFVGGPGFESGNAVATDLAGNVYVVGSSSITFGTPVRPHGGQTDAYVAKLDPDGNVLWVTFLGGALSDEAFGVSTDGTMVAVSGVSAATWGEGEAPNNPRRPFSGGGNDGWVALLSAASGDLAWNTFLGGGSVDFTRGVLYVPSGPDAGIYVAGESNSSWGPVPQRPYSGSFDGWVAKVDSNLGTVTWLTFLGGPGFDSARGLALGSGLFVGGVSSGRWGSPVRPHTYDNDGFVARLDPGSGNLVWNTFLGGFALDSVESVATIGTDLYVAGFSGTPWGSPVRPYAGGVDGFVARLHETGALLAHTFLGAVASDEKAFAIATDGSRVYVAGEALSTWGSPLRQFSGYLDGFVAGLQPDLTLVWNTFLGGPGLDRSKALALPLAGGLYVAGWTETTPSAPNPSWGQGECPSCPLAPFSGSHPTKDAFVAKLPTVVADLAITKTDGRLFIVAGEPLTYTITATNHGPDVVPQARVLDVFPSNFESPIWTCAASGGADCGDVNGSVELNQLVYLPVGGSVTYTVSGTVNSLLLGSLVNTAEVSADGVADPVPGNNSATDGSSAGRLADLSVTKTDGLAQALPGSTDTYTITVHNAGPSAAGVQLTDTFPSDFQNPTWTCTIGGISCGLPGSGGSLLETFLLAPGEDAVYTVHGTISNAATGVLTNTATVAVINGGSELDPTNNSATDQTSLTAAADLSITKTDGVKIVTAGGSTTYTIVAANAGPSATSATVTDNFPAALTCTWTCVGAGGGTCTAAGSGNIGDSVNLPAGASVTYTASCTISGGATDTIKNFATVSSSTFDPNSVNNTTSDADGVGSAADLVILKTDFRTIAAPGEQAIYSILVSNLGPSNVTGATVTDAFPVGLVSPTWTCTPSGGASCAAAGSGNINDTTVNLPSGSSVTYNLTAKIDPATTISALTNTATVSSSVPELDPANNTATDTTQLQAGADLLVIKGDGVAVASPGDAVTYSILVTNQGPSNVPSALVTDALPAALINATWTCTPSGGATCTASGTGSISGTVSLPAKGSVAYTLHATINPAFTGTLSNTATVSSNVTDPVPGNSSFTDDTKVLLPLAPSVPMSSIPTLSEWGLLLLAALLGFNLWWRGPGWLAGRR